MRTRPREERGNARRRGVEVQRGLLAERTSVFQGYFHKEVVRMLAIGDRRSKSRFPGLEEFRLTPLRDRRGFEAEHGAKHEAALSNAVFGHTHKPVGGKQFVRSPRPGLLRVREKEDAVKHQVPTGGFAKNHFPRGGFGVSARPRSLLPPRPCY